MCWEFRFSHGTRIESTSHSLDSTSYSLDGTSYSLNASEIIHAIVLDGVVVYYGNQSKFRYVDPSQLGTGIEAARLQEPRLQSKFVAKRPPNLHLDVIYGVGFSRHVLGTIKITDWRACWVPAMQISSGRTSVRGAAIPICRHLDGGNG